MEREFYWSLSPWGYVFNMEPTAFNPNLMSYRCQNFQWRKRYTVGMHIFQHNKATRPNLCFKTWVVFAITQVLIVKIDKYILPDWFIL